MFMTRLSERLTLVGFIHPYYLPYASQISVLDTPQEFQIMCPHLILLLRTQHCEPNLNHTPFLWVVPQPVTQRLRNVPS